MRVGRRASDRLLLAIALLAFVSLGLPDGVLGVAWPSVRAAFDLPLSELGVILTAAMLGYLGSSFSSGWMVSRIGVGRLLVWSSVLMVANCGGYALAPRWPVMVASGVLAGLGAGAIDAGINAFAAARLPPRLVSWLHACYGVGAMLGPLLMTGMLAGGHSWRWGYAIIGALLAAMAVAFTLTRSLWDARPRLPGPSASAELSPGLFTTLGRPLVWLNLMLFFVYTGIEVVAGQWTYSLLTEARSVPIGTAGIWVAGYWASLTLGRLVFGGLAERRSSAALLRVGTIGVPVGALVLWLAPGRWAGLVGLLWLGFALAPIYPLLIAETPKRLGARHATNAIGFQVAAAYLGTAALPGLAGLLARRHGLEVIGPFLFAASLLLLALRELSARWPARSLTRRAADPAPASALRAAPCAPGEAGT